MSNQVLEICLEDKEEILTGILRLLNQILYKSINTDTNKISYAIENHKNDDGIFDYSVTNKHPIFMDLEDVEFIVEYSIRSAIKDEPDKAKLIKQDDVNMIGYFLEDYPYEVSNEN